MQTRKTRSLALWAAVAALFAASAPLAQPPAEQAPLRGDAARGAPLFADTYNCYACHGFDAQTGERRLLPMRYTQEGFITFVQRSPLPQMPAFPDVPAQDLADIYAYIRSLPEGAPSLDTLPLLKGIYERQLAALEE